MSLNSVNAPILTAMILLCFSNIIFANDINWNQINPDKLGQRTPKVEPNEDAEAILRDGCIGEKKNGEFKLSEDETLEGLVRIKYNRQPIIKGRQQNFLDSPSKSEEEIAKVKSQTNKFFEPLKSPANVSDTSNITFPSTIIKINNNDNILKNNRNFFFGKGGNLFFPKNSYFVLKTLFDAFHKADTHSITLKQK